MPEGIEILGPMGPDHAKVLTTGAIRFIAALHRRFVGDINMALGYRIGRQGSYDEGRGCPHFLDQTKHIREDPSWKVAPIPDDLQDRRVEITGPVSRKMVINALNSGANVFMADFEDSNSPTWDNVVLGQLNLMDAVTRTITFESPKKTYELNDEVAVLFARPRGFHLLEKHVTVDGQFVPASLFDFGLYFYHNVECLMSNGSGPYFYLPKLESHREARLWNDIFKFSQDYFDMPQGTIRATVLIETLHAAFEMEEILYELKDHSAGLNCGRWDYIFSYIKTLKASHAIALPDRGQITMEQPFMRTYASLLVRTCHKRGIHAMGGMAAQIPIKNDPQRNADALEKVREDKEREVELAYDGTWVAHPALVPIAKDVFDQHMKGPNQIHHPGPVITLQLQQNLLEAPLGTRTMAALRQNISVGVQYIAAWLSGNGCVPLYDLMEDAATAEISRTQVWQWMDKGAELESGETVDALLVGGVTGEELEKIRLAVGDEQYQRGHYEEAADIFLELSTSNELADFLTIPAYEKLLEIEKGN